MTFFHTSLRYVSTHKSYGLLTIHFDNNVEVSSVHIITLCTHGHHWVYWLLCACVFVWDLFLVCIIVKKLNGCVQCEYSKLLTNERQFKNYFHDIAHGCLERPEFYDFNRVSCIFVDTFFTPFDWASKKIMNIFQHISTVYTTKPPACCFLRKSKKNNLFVYTNWVLALIQNEYALAFYFHLWQVIWISLSLSPSMYALVANEFESRWQNFLLKLVFIRSQSNAVKTAFQFLNVKKLAFPFDLS